MEHQEHNGCIGHPVTNLLLQGAAAPAALAEAFAAAVEGPTAAPASAAEGNPDAAEDEALAQAEAMFERACRDYDEAFARSIRIESKLDAILSHLGVTV